MQIRILGPIEVASPGRSVTLGGLKQRTVLAVLALHHGEVVSPDVLIEATWGDQLPSNPANALQYQIAQLRRILENDPSSPTLIVTRSNGYLLNPDTTSLDAKEFAAKLVDARVSYTSGELARAADEIEGALALWRGPAFGEFTYDEFAHAAAARLEGERIVAEELRIDIALADGRHAETVPTLSQLTLEHPTREGLWARRMTALYRDGSQTDALRVYQQARRSLAELGIEPSAELRQLEQGILDQDPGLDPPHPDTARRSTPGNLPASPNRLIGRVDEVSAITERLADDRLVTLIGSGGAGKTRLALEVARTTASTYREGAWLVRLDQLDGPELVTSLIGQSIGLRENPELDILNSLVNHVGDGRILIVLDNCEHLLDAVAAFTVEFLERCGQARVLATSQAILDIQGESVFEVQPLTLPGESDSIYDRLDDVAAVELFLDRARSAGRSTGDWSDQELVAVSNIVTALDGVPLAVELAAARTRSMSLNEIAQGLADPATVLTRGSRTAPVRQRTLTGVVEWSLRLLEPAQRSSLIHLSVFVGGFDTESAASVIDATVPETRELLGTLVDRSLLVRMDDVVGSARYRMLETLRQYCTAQLDHDALTAARDAHLVRFDQFTSSATAGIVGHDQLSWLARFDADYENIRASLTWALDDGSLEVGLRIGTNLGRWWDWRGLLKEASEWLARLSDAATSQLPGTAGVRAWCAYFLWEFGDVEQATTFVTQAGEAAEATKDPQDRLLMLFMRALIARSEGDLDGARRDCNELASIAGTTGDPWAVAWAHSALATISLAANDLDGSDSHSRTAVEMFQDLGDMRGVGWGLVSMAQTALGFGHLERADALAREALSASNTTMDYRNTSWVLEILAQIAVARGDREQAAVLWGAAHPFLRQRGLTSSASKRDELENLERALEEDLGETYSDLFTEGSSDPDAVIRHVLSLPV